MACVFYQMSLLPRISLDFFFFSPDAVLGRHDKHSWKAVTIGLRHGLSG